MFIMETIQWNWREFLSSLVYFTIFESIVQKSDAELFIQMKQFFKISKSQEHIQIWKFNTHSF